MARHHITFTGAGPASRVRLWAAMASVLTLTPASAALLLNGSFESPLVPSGSGSTFPVGSAGLTNWSVFGPSGQAVSVTSGSLSQFGVTFPAQDGAQWLDLTGLNNNGPAGVSQSVATIAGHLYEVSYYIGNTTGGLVFGTTSTVQLLVNGVQTFSDTNATVSPNTLSWTRYVHTFEATSATTTLGFRNGDPSNDNSNGLDNIVLTDLGSAHASVPEPATWALCGFALAGMGSVIRRRPRVAVARLECEVPPAVD